MAPPTAPLNLDVDAISGICGSISIACWVVVFSPQIITNWRRGSAEGLSLQFVIVWLLGDVFNILGAVFQGVLPTMLILAVYYTIADIVLLGQCFYYRGFTWRDEVVKPAEQQQRRQRRSRRVESRTNGNGHSNGYVNGNGNGNGHLDGSADAGVADERSRLLAHSERRGSDWSDRLSHLNPVLPMVEPSAEPVPPSTGLQQLAWNTLAVLMVMAAGVVGWFLSSRGYGSPPPPPSTPDPSGGGDSGTGKSDEIHFDFWGQIFGWLCAVLYLGSRLPQLLLNWRRKSTEGVSMLFFLFACLGNLTYVLSILAFDPGCRDDASSPCRPADAGRVYGHYILVNLSWLAGSFGTLLLDMGIFAQFFMYRDAGDDESGESAIDDSVYDSDERSIDSDERSIDGERWDQRPILERSQSQWST